MRLIIINYLFRSLKEFGRLISAIEDEKERMLDQAQQFIIPLENFRKVFQHSFTWGLQLFSRLYIVVILRMISIIKIIL